MKPRLSLCVVVPGNQSSCPKKIGIFMLSVNSPGTILCNMDSVPCKPKVANLSKCWNSGVPKTLVENTEDELKAPGFLCGCGRLLFVTRDRQIDRCVVEQFSVSVIDVAHPHCAPGSEGRRAVLFLTFQPPRTKTQCDGGTPVSRQKLIFLLPKVVMKKTHVNKMSVDFLADKFVECSGDRASLCGATDHTPE